MSDYDNTNSGALFNADNRTIIRAGDVDVEGKQERMMLVETKTKDGNKIYSVYREVGTVKATPEEKKKENSPDSSGVIKTEHGEHWVYLRKKVSKNNVPYTHVGLKEKEPDEPKQDTTPPQSDAPPPNPYALDDDIPF